jgi:hypothetical protein
MNLTFNEGAVKGSRRRKYSSMEIFEIFLPFFFQEFLTTVSEPRIPP